MTQIDTEYLDNSDLAKRYKRTESAIREMRRRRTGPPGARFGRKTLYRLDEVLAWEQAQFDKENGR